ncbi:fibronectin type III domain-containing protein [Gilvimarinus sp. DA14]|uniref:fibronectin type III domain-containing protein n=1 Tax=Gilvimarinus sp. DA14 TaxID=2956798 RepID=UPI0020B8D6C0|nr:fibronectin type III domain-containing protein [Gilvimarinus sp. DA14]UTF60243.1 fibronectin type III domain-containing protein [Gilvimarinus sp. DA14]
MRITGYIGPASIAVCSLLLAACGGDSNNGGSSSSAAAQITISTESSTGGTLTPSELIIDAQSEATLAVTSHAGYQLASISGCDGELNGSDYVISSVNDDCMVTADFEITPPTLTLTANPGRQVTLQWSSTGAAIDEYRVQRLAPEPGTFDTIATLPATTHEYTFTASIEKTTSGVYKVQACINDTCTDSNTAELIDQAAGFIETFAVPASDDANHSEIIFSQNGRAAYIVNPEGDCHGCYGIDVYNKTDDQWTKTDRLILPVSERLIESGTTTPTVTTSESGDVLVVAAEQHSVQLPDQIEQSRRAGVIYLYKKTNSQWSEPQIIVSQWPGELRRFGGSVALSADGKTLVAGSSYGGPGAWLDITPQPPWSYWFSTEKLELWSNKTGEWQFDQAIDIDTGEYFGADAKLSDDGNVLVARSSDELGSHRDATGSIHIFARADNIWTRQNSFSTQLDESITNPNSTYGANSHLSGDGETLYVESTNFLQNDPDLIESIDTFTKTDGEWQLLSSDIIETNSLPPARTVTVDGQFYQAQVAETCPADKVISISTSSDSHYIELREWVEGQWHHQICFQAEGYAQHIQALEDGTMVLVLNQKSENFLFLLF